MSSTTAAPTAAAPSGPRTRGGPRRGGRVGGGGGAGTGAKGAAGAAAAQPDDTEEVRKLRAKFANQLAVLRELFPSWSDEDLLLAVQEAGGDVDVTAERISEGAYRAAGITDSALEYAQTCVKRRSHTDYCFLHPSFLSCISLQGMLSNFHPSSRRRRPARRPHRRRHRSASMGLEHQLLTLQLPTLEPEAGAAV